MRAVLRYHFAKPSLAAIASVVFCATGHRAEGECRPYVFGMGHYLATWAGEPWTYDEQAMDKMVEMYGEDWRSQNEKNRDKFSS